MANTFLDGRSHISRASGTRGAAIAPVIKLVDNRAPNNL
jgi:hypothetical protein